MVVIVELNVGMQDNIISFNHPGQQINEMLMIPVVSKYSPAAQPLGCYMIPPVLTCAELAEVAKPKGPPDT